MKKNKKINNQLIKEGIFYWQASKHALSGLPEIKRFIKKKLAQDGQGTNSNSK